MSKRKKAIMDQNSSFIKNTLRNISDVFCNHYFIPDPIGAKGKCANCNLEGKRNMEGTVEWKS